MQIKKQDLIKLVAVLGIAIVLIFMAINRKTTSAKAKGKVPAGYTLVTSVPGVSFIVNTPFIDKATAISQISPNMEFARNGLYSYKNGADKYLMFSLDQIVIAAQKGTDFDFIDNGADALLGQKASVCGIWFNADRKNLEYEAKGQRAEATVTGGVVITNELYNDFIGKLVTVDDGENEYALFIGLPGTKYKDLDKNQKEIIENIAESFGLHNEPVKANSGPEYEVIISGNIISDTVSEDDLLSPEEVSGNGMSGNYINISTNTVSEDSISDNSVSGNTVSMDSVSMDSVSSDTLAEEALTEEPAEETIEIPDEEIPTVGNEDDEAPSEETEEPLEKATEEITGSTEEPPAEEVTETAETHPEESGETEEETTEDEKDKGIRITKTRARKGDRNTAFTSTPYQMLDITSTGLYEVYDTAAKSYSVEQAAVTVDKIYGKDSAQDLVNTFKPEVGEKPVLPPGCHWEAVGYTLRYSGNNLPYTNVKFAGLDGEALRFMGIKYTMRTYDIDYGETEGTTVRNKVTLYAVPNGCKEYSLIFGGDTLGKIRAAYYEITRD